MSRTFQIIVWILVTLLTLLCFVVLLPSLFGLVMVTLLVFFVLDFAARRKRNSIKALNSTLRAVCRHDGAITKVAVAFSRSGPLRGPCYEFARRLMMGQDPLEAATRARVPLMLATAVAMQNPASQAIERGSNRPTDQDRFYEPDDNEGFLSSYGQLVYLVLTAMITCVVFSFMGLFIVPTLELMFEEFGITNQNRRHLSPQPAYWILSLLCFIVLVLIPLMSCGTLLGFRFPRWFPVTPRLAQHKSDVLCGLADAIDHGWPMGRALAVGHMISIRKHERRSLQYAMELIEQGRSPAQAIFGAGWIDAIEAAWLDGASPQRTADLLRTIADQSIRDSRAKIRWLMSLMFPTLVVLIAAAVLTYAFGFFSTLFQMIEALA